jgi:benzoate 4-monooxygenase
MKYLPTLTDTLLVLLVLFALFVLAHIVVYVVDTHQLQSVPGPWLAKFSDAWLVYVSFQGRRSETVYELHKQYGPIVRIAPNHVSVADPNALQAIYGHHAGTTKANFYDAFVSIARGLFNSRDRAEHARKRKIVSHAFAPKNVAEFEPNVRQYVGQLIDQWDRLCDLAVKDGSGEEGEGGWYGKNGRLWIDCLPCMHLHFTSILFFHHIKI